MNQSNFVIRECEKCHREMQDSERRIRCKRRVILICQQCFVVARKEERVNETY